MAGEREELGSRSERVEVGVFCVLRSAFCVLRSAFCVLRSALVLALSAGIGAKSQRWPFRPSDRVLRAGRQAIVWDKNRKYNQRVQGLLLLEEPERRDVEVG